MSNDNRLRVRHYLKIFQMNYLLPITIEWLEQQQIRFNHSNCILVDLGEFSSENKIKTFITTIDSHRFQKTS
jgi:hypothetical protein